MLPVNAATRKSYRGVNTIVLWATAQAESYPSAVWATYRQWAELGAQVRKGETSSPVVFWKISDKEEQDDADDGAEDGRRSRVFARSYAVFNAAQVDGYAAPAARRSRSRQRTPRRSRCARPRAARAGQGPHGY